ncbi:MAG: hypothetical protein R6V28_00190 [Nitriliruptoraceae bacterium]
MSSADQTSTGDGGQSAKAAAEQKVEQYTAKAEQRVDTAKAEQKVQQLKAKAEERVDKVKAEVDKAKQTVGEVGKEVSSAVDERRGGPATSVAEAEQKAATLRAGLEQDLAALQARVPDRDDLTGRLRSTALAVGGTIAAVTTIVVLFSRRRAAKASERDLQAQAEALAAVLNRAERVRATAGDEDEDDGGGWLAGALLLLGAGGAGAYWWQQRRSADTDEVWVPEPE